MQPPRSRSRSGRGSSARRPALGADRYRVAAPGPTRPRDRAPSVADATAARNARARQERAARRSARNPSSRPPNVPAQLTSQTREVAYQRKPSSVNACLKGLRTVSKVRVEETFDGFNPDLVAPSGGEAQFNQGKRSRWASKVGVRRSSSKQPLVFPVDFAVNEFCCRPTEPAVTRCCPFVSRRASLQSGSQRRR